jgi:hypothetical protein
VVEGQLGKIGAVQDADDEVASGRDRDFVASLCKTRSETQRNKAPDETNNDASNAEEKTTKP